MSNSRRTETAKLLVLNLCYGFCKEVKELHLTSGEAQCQVELLREIDILYQESLGGILSMVKMTDVEKDVTGQSGDNHLFNGHALELEPKWVRCRLVEKILDFYEAALILKRSETEICDLLTDPLPPIPFGPLVWEVFRARRPRMRWHSLARLYTSQDAQAKEFWKNIAQYNTALSFTSLDVNDNRSINTGGYPILHA
ncbi:hypothetical protein R3P38DRAFT_3184496 [Favolaschia claudopus]|uniref:Uncharacterized protein n=1 Tax=Favolaschia claudopus TaxID=2862362 RepID=A0AAW0C9P8_9AGAR